MTLLEYIKLNPEEKSGIIKASGSEIDQYVEKGRVITVYRVHNFFVEISVCLANGKLVDLIPYKRGFSLSLTNKKRADSLNYYFLL